MDTRLGRCWGSERGLVTGKHGAMTPGTSPPLSRPRPADAASCTAGAACRWYQGRAGLVGGLPHTVWSLEIWAPLGGPATCTRGGGRGGVPPGAALSASTNQPTNRCIPPAMRCAAAPVPGLPGWPGRKPAGSARPAVPACSACAEALPVRRSGCARLPCPGPAPPRPAHQLVCVQVLAFQRCQLSSRQRRQLGAAVLAAGGLVRNVAVAAEGAAVGALLLEVSCRQGERWGRGGGLR